jgi:hypothetical protein
MSLMPIGSKNVGGACVVALSFWFTLKLLDYQDSPTAASSDSTVAENNAPRGSAPSRAIQLFDERSSRVDNLADHLECRRGPRRLAYGHSLGRPLRSITQEVPVGNDERTRPPEQSERGYGAERRGTISSKFLGNSWFRIKLSGPTTRREIPSCSCGSIRGMALPRIRVLAI